MTQASDHELPERALSGFEAVTGLRVCVHDLLGGLEPVLPPERGWHGGPLCALIKRGPFAHHCVAFEVTSLRRQLTDLIASEGRVHRCHAGLIEWVVPVTSQGRASAILFAGQRRARSWQPDHRQNLSGARVPRQVPRIERQSAEHLLECLRQLAVRLAQWLHQQTSHGRGTPTRAHRIRRFLDLHHAHAVSLEDLADELGISLSRTAHVVRETTGRSFSDLLREARLRTACRLLRHSDESITAIALASGFGDQSHLQRSFRRHFGTTPGRYRRDPEIAGRDGGDGNDRHLLM